MIRVTNSTVELRAWWASYVARSRHASRPALADALARMVGIVADIGRALAKRGRRAKRDGPLARTIPVVVSNAAHLGEVDLEREGACIVLRYRVRPWRIASGYFRDVYRDRE